MHGLSEVTLYKLNITYWLFVLDFFFCIFIFMSYTIGVLLKSMVESCLLSENGLLTPSHTDKVMAV